MKTEIRFDRLRELSAHLKSGRPGGHREFDFNVVHRGRKSKNHCGSAGCAIGEMVAVWPNVFSIYGSAQLMVFIFPRNHPDSAGSPVRDWFGLTSFQTEHLFYPNEQNTDLCGGVELDVYATAEQVAANIDAFIEKMGAKQ